MRVILIALMLALAGVAFVGLATEEAAAFPPCDFRVFGGTQCCWYIDENNNIWWEPC